MRLLSFLLATWLLTGCCGMDFEPYDYKKSEDAKLKKDDYSIRLRGKQLQFEKKIQLQP